MNANKFLWSWTAGNVIGIAYITHMFPKLKTLKQKQDLSSKMLHSRDLQEKYVSIKDMD